MEDMNAAILNLEKAALQNLLAQKFELDKDPALEDSEIDKLIGYSSILSLSDNPEEASLSYEIITRLLECTESKISGVVVAAEIILSRIGNFPGRDLLRKRYTGDTQTSIPTMLKLEAIARESENTIFTNEGEEKSAILTDFQFKLLNFLSSEKSLSVSAPTSAGKSFVLSIDLISRIRKENKQSIVYIVPTRALITEVSSRIRLSLKNSKIDGVVVRTAPFPVPKDKIDRAAVYVFTQERLMSFINSDEGSQNITALIVDEAHEIQKGKRGIILHSAIEIAIRKFDVKNLFFASPLIKNPVYFLSLFGKLEEGKYFLEAVSPVSQNLILLSEVKNKPNKIEASLLSRGVETPIGIVTTNFKFRDPKGKKKANIAHSIYSGGESVIVFSNGQGEAEDIAFEIKSLLGAFDIPDEISTFIEFIKSEIHPKHPLIESLESGVAFHYGSMPSLVRSGVEELFKGGLVKILCCTSTLLQGVNLPAKHIIIDNPKSGKGNPMSRSDFLNLSGRAGRLVQEFHGNIWCINPSTWESSCHTGEKLQEISSAISELMADGGTAIQKLLESSLDSEKEKDEAEAAFGKIFHDYRESNSLDFIEQFRNEKNSNSLDKTVEEIKKVEVTIPNEILENHQSLRPDHLQNLYLTLSEILFFEGYIPASPYVKGSNERMGTIFSVICDCFDWSLDDRYRNLISMIASSWIRGEKIGKILSDRVSWVEENKPNEKISNTIRNCLNVLETEIRFKLVKYYSAYIDILKHVLSERGITDLIEEIEPYHIYLEFGSSNRHALNLMALGISRFTALYLEGKFDFDQDVQAEAYLEKLKGMNLNSISMPSLCLKEIIDLIS
ncbi:DEAD/DEAH box helicase [Saccharophagus degradans]|uniref:DEAD/DEAH box helicase n=1 Tax=Saccharophagus degradans TaxID=86304 RepID=UPI002090B11C|nr:DEAD/DEAH box helicase [Saccharophagus degradans]